MVAESEFLAELIGTMILIILGSGVVGGVTLKSSKAEGSGWVVITIAWGLAVAFGVYAVGNYSPAHINPAVTIGFASIGEFPWSKVPMYVTAQVIGAIIGAAVVFVNYLPHWRKTKDQATKLGVFATGPAIRSPLANLLSEIVGTFVLVLGLLFIGANEFTEGLNPIIVGVLIIAIGMSLGGATGYAINPARDLGPRIAHALLPIPGKGSSDWGYAWVPIIGPIIGGIYGAFFYDALFIGEFTIIFWALSIIIAILIIGAVRMETKGERSAKINNHSA
ncbi:aquaporin family protein [Virgibacillus pantothenticus]|uniref:MIP/aquaporin family protein n=2 Tax=Bacillaceae TaxID=186817 RepID=UPI00090A9CC9|nr:MULTISPECIES: MIP/aquaporin family protein [Virgibacillus]API93343.1 aquaporin [Virgibacillus sp. 6R]MBS7428603.1 aquaporin family protein [Virgibacillus sp. 19R1-5]MBU8567524.1 aquaporin family protein [Virgibacillus pantothenticus]MBU8601313.1 aquaporin family protein [Virgibacillus pantothenticus]MBU8636953.1 aquaporin family protein [Virgibacillus pantothenticus]